MTDTPAPRRLSVVRPSVARDTHAASANPSAPSLTTVLSERITERALHIAAVERIPWVEGDPAPWLVGALDQILDALHPASMDGEIPAAKPKRVYGAAVELAARALALARFVAADAHRDDPPGTQYILPGLALPREPLERWVRAELVGLVGELMLAWRAYADDLEGGDEVVSCAQALASLAGRVALYRGVR